jgi:hypothetical protein
VENYSVFHSLIFDFMFIQLIIAMILGLAYPSDSNNSCANQGGTVSTFDDGPGTGGNGGQTPPPPSPN